jgi:isoleucyl-tRNA synthetase
MFKPVDSRADIQKIEKDQLDFWRANRIFERTMTEREGNPTYVFYEGPPTANGMPGSHHVLARAFKDMFPRYKTMRGFYSYRKGGWDTHGLPVEIAVQKELGIEDKREIYEYGIDKFNKKCRDTVFRNITDWERLTERMAYWVNLDDAYVTFTNDYIESVWWILKQFWQKGLLFQGHKVVPYSPSSGTPLSSHEVSLGYKEITDPSVYVRFPVKNEQGTYLLAWTTTPWTLPSNVALAVGPDVDYVKVEGPVPNSENGDTERLILAEALIEKALTDHESYTVIERMKGTKVAGMNYNPLYTFIPVDGKKYAYVVEGDFVSTSDGTGIVHMAPAYGEDDMRMGEQYDLPVIKAVEEDGRFVKDVTPFKGQWFVDANPEIVRDLKHRGLLYRRFNYTHSYPHDWRTGKPLMYFARPTWFLRATEYKKQMVDLNQTVKWVPDHIKDGRFGNWLDDLKDWALGRERFWGTPLPVWVDDQTGEEICVGSVAELSELTGQDLSELDLHRPYVDDITFPNPNGGGTMRRVPEVIDVWFDSGAMPFAQWGYPINNQDKFENQYPADYICEAVDQTRGWFYSLHAISAMLNESVAFKNVISLGHILDENGEKMSKSKGNIVDPWSVFNSSGADAFRWYCYTASPPGEPRRFSEKLVNEVITKFYLTLWNTYSFFVTYANIANWDPTTEQTPVSERPVLDRWVLAYLHQLTQDVTAAYEDYNVTDATRPVQTFVDELSNWYVRLTRDRFWNEDADALATLHECLVTVSKLIAPAMPFLSETLYRNLVSQVQGDAPDSVHLAMWPEYDEATIDANLLRDMDVAQKLVNLGRAARESIGVGVRQPLATAQFVAPTRAEGEAVERLQDIILAELNVKGVETLDDAEGFVKYSLNPIPRYLGRKFGQDFPRVQKVLREGDPADIRKYADALLAGKNLVVEVGEDTFEVTPEEVEVIRDVTTDDRYALAEEGGYLAALDTTLTENLIAEGFSNEVKRRIQVMRKDAGFEIEDRINVIYQASERLAAAIEQFREEIMQEVLALSLTAETPADGFHSETFEAAEDAEATSIKSETFTLGVKRTTA